VALETSAEHPVPVRTVSRLLADWIGRLGRVWVEGQVTQVSRRPGAGTVFLTLRDPVADVSLQVTCPRAAYDALVPPLSDGARVVVHARPELFLARGSLSLAATEIRPVGVGELLARLERLRRTLAAEGLFAAERKRPLPFLPEVVGLVCGRGSAAEHDVLENTRRRWPSVRFRVCNVAVQGPYAVTEVVGALRELDADPAVEVIVVARGGGSVEDLLPFSDEGLLRAVHAARTPVVSAIGHEPDTPLLDLVADVRASTPTDAAKLVVPDVAEETDRITRLRDRARHVFGGWLAQQQHQLDVLRARPSLADPRSGLDDRSREIEELCARTRRTIHHRLEHARTDLGHQLARVRSLSPLATLERGYAVVQDAGGHVVTRTAQARPGQQLTIRVRDGRIHAKTTSATPGPVVELVEEEYS